MVGGVYRNIWFIWGMYRKVHIKASIIENVEGLGWILLMFLAIFAWFSIYTPVEHKDFCTHPPNKKISCS